MNTENKTYLIYKFNDSYYGQPSVLGIYNSLEKLQKDFPKCYINHSGNNTNYLEFFTKELEIFEYIDSEELYFIEEVPLNEKINIL